MASTNGAASERWRLFTLSFLMLFVELALIRWLGSNVVYLSYFSNFVLLGSFLGIGIGFLRYRFAPDLFPWALVALAFLVAFVSIFPVELNRSGNDVIYFGAPPSGPPIWITLPVIFLSVAFVMAAIACGVAKSFAAFEALEAYRLDVLGSLAGIAVFSLLSFLGAPPVVWGAVVAVTFVALYRPALRLVEVAAAIALVAMLGHESFQPGFSWSPYYKVVVFDIAPGVKGINVNGIPHQIIASTAVYEKIESLYYKTYLRAPHNALDDVLVVGAGNGVDVALALAKGAGRVDAVEIDPRIYQIGVRVNPDRPYQDRRVSVHIDDGRAFLERTKKRYDLILFALPDSLTLVQGQSSLRLESYLFTVEAMRAARAHLRPGGAFGMYNDYREPWLIDRLAHTLETVYGHRPCIDEIGTAGRLAILTIGLEPSGVTCGVEWSPHAQPLVEPATDDRPFVYLHDRAIPKIYLVTVAAILLVSLVAVRAAGGPLRRMRPYADVFFMGAAFLLLETKNVVQFALLFGTTWLVNAMVFFGILLAVLAAIEVAKRVRAPNLALWYAALFASLALAYAVPPEWLLALDVPARLASATTLAFMPVFLANVIFAERFRETASSTTAFAANLLGAMTGGVLEYLSLAIGYRDLTLVLGALYALAYLFGRASVPAAAEAL